MTLLTITIVNSKVIRPLGYFIFLAIQRAIFQLHSGRATRLLITIVKNCNSYGALK